MSDSQNYSHHTRWDPPYHFFIMPIFVLALIAAIVHVFCLPRPHTIAGLILALAAVGAIFKMRLYALKVQDRLIRFEERLRLASLADPALRARINDLTGDQLIALRFASDAEVCALASRALNEKLSKADIKKSIQTWRPDNFRV